MLKRFFQMPQQEYLFIFLATGTLLFDLFIQDLPFDLGLIIMTVALLGSMPILIRAFSVLLNWGFSTEVLYLLALLALFFEGEILSMIFVCLILSLGRLLDFYARSASKDITKDFYGKIPETAFRQNRNIYDEIPIGWIKNGDLLLVKEKERVPVDGVVVFGEAQVNELSVTGSSISVKKVLNDKVFSSSMVISGIIKIQAICTSKESVFVRKTKLIIEETEKKRSSLQYFADKLAEYFLPTVFIAGIIVYLITDNIIMTSAFFLVVCHRGITIVIPFAFKKVFNIAARYGVIVKSDRKFVALGKIKTVILDKTDLLAFGSFQIKDVYIEEGISKTDFWASIAIAEKYSEDSVNKILFREAMKYTERVPDAHKYQVYKGAGVYAQYGRDNIIVGNKKLLSEVKVKFPRGFQKKLDDKNKKHDHTTVFIAINDIFVGAITVADMPEKSVRASVEELHKIGVEKIIIFTDNNEATSQSIANALGIDEQRFSLTLEEKRAEVKRLSKISSVAVVGDGRGDYSTIIHRGVDIAMGKDCTALPSRNSDIVILNDDLRLLPKLILSSRALTRTTYGNIGIWFITNVFGMLFVSMSIVGPVFAVLYSFIAESVHLYPFLRSSRARKKILCKTK